jgi:hypothetical protein
MDCFVASLAAAPRNDKLTRHRDAPGLDVRCDRRLDAAMRPARQILPLLFAVALLPGCRAAPDGEVYDGFDGRKLSDVWDLDRCVPGSVELQSAVVRAGRGAAKITVRQGDKYEGVDPLQSKPTERDELLERNDLVTREGDGFAYSFSIFLPKDFLVVPTRLVLAQWKQFDRKHTALVDNPVVAVRYQGGELSVTLQTSRQKQTLFRTTEEIRGRWLDFIFHLKFTRAPEGLVRVWLNGCPVCDFHGVTAYTEEFGYPQNGRFYFKMGLYRDRMPEPMTAYFDEYRKRPLTAAEEK